MLTWLFRPPPLSRFTRHKSIRRRRRSRPTRPSPRLLQLPSPRIPPADPLEWDCVEHPGLSPATGQIVPATAPPPLSPAAALRQQARLLAGLLALASLTTACAPPHPGTSLIVASKARIDSANISHQEIRVRSNPFLYAIGVPILHLELCGGEVVTQVSGIGEWDW